MKNQVNEYTDMRFGFPVRLVGFPTKDVRGEQVLDINGNLLRNLVLAALAKKSGPLTGNEVRFVRLWQKKTLAEFGEELGVSHPAVIKWEACGNEPTKMSLAVESQIRFSILERLPEEFLAKLIEPDVGEPISISGILKTIRRMLTRSTSEPGLIELTPETVRFIG